MPFLELWLVGGFHGKKVLGPGCNGRGEEAPQSCRSAWPSFPGPCYACESRLTSSPTDCAPLRGHLPHMPAAWLRSAELVVTAVRRVLGIISLSKRFDSDALQLPTCC